MLVQIFFWSWESPKLKSKYAILTNRKPYGSLQTFLSSDKTTNQTKQQYTLIEVSLRLRGRICDHIIKIIKVIREEWFGSFMVMNSGTLSDIFHNCGPSLSWIVGILRNLTRWECQILGKSLPSTGPPFSHLLKSCD